MRRVRLFRLPFGPIRRVEKSGTEVLLKPLLGILLRLPTVFRDSIALQESSSNTRQEEVS